MLLITDLASANCIDFADEAALDTRKAYWVKQLNKLPQSQTIGWLIGIHQPLPAALSEAKQQRECMLKASRHALHKKITLPKQLTYSGLRSFNRQKAIWTRKYLFRGSAFSRISDHARQRCPDLLFKNETLWRPNKRRHRQCWRGGGQSLPAGNYALTADERQAEILQASSAPGTSRHHWGTDFDLYDPHMNPDNWQSDKKLAVVYTWLQQNAQQYGFFQPYKAVSYPSGKAYIEERWHWSYYPIAAALSTILKQQQNQVEQALIKHWGSPQRFSYIQRYWRDYVFNISIDH